MNYTDQELSEVTSKITLPLSFKLSPTLSPVSRRESLFKRLLNGWNIERNKAGFNSISPKRLAIAINSNPFLKKDDGELELLIKDCETKGNYKKAHWTLFSSKK